MSMMAIRLTLASMGIGCVLAELKLVYAYAGTATASACMYIQRSRRIQNVVRYGVNVPAPKTFLMTTIVVLAH